MRKRRFRSLIRYLPFALVCAIALGALYVAYVVKSLPSVEQLSSLQISQSAKIYDRTGTVLLYEINGGQKRTVVPFDQIPQSLKDATVVTEDAGFYSEPGFSWRGFLRALFVDLRHLSFSQGGSTITQQLAKNAFLSPEQTISRKIKEFLLSLQLSRRYSKDQILGFYLNEIPYGATAYGVEAASEQYFGKSAKDLSIAESAILAALPRAPSYYSPWGTHQKELLAREQYLLQKMYEAKKITELELKRALAEKIVFAPQSKGIRAPHFVLAVQEYLSQKYGEERVLRGGLKITTTLDWDLQQKAEKAVQDGAKSNEALYQGKNAALVAQDATTGQILALVGSRDYFDTKNEGNFNVATQGLRQPGSALKPFVYLTAFEKGFTPDTTLFDVPIEFSTNPACPTAVNFLNDDSRCFHPENFDEKFRGPLSMRNALAQSVNVPAVEALYLAGLPNVIKTARDFGLATLTDPQRYGLSLVLGGGEVRLADLVEAYSVLAQEGVKREQTMVLEVRDGNNNILESFADRAERIVDAKYPRLINDVLSDTQARSGLFERSLSLTVFPEHDVALKTGTSNDYRDAWALGYTPSLVVGVWAGNNDNSPMQRHGSSILAAVPIWHALMADALQNQPLTTFNRPDPISVSKPILRGDYLAGRQIHSILYYVNHNDPLGPEPVNPGDDPQFRNWETAVLGWASNNIPDFASYNQPLSPSSPAVSALGDAPPHIDVRSPQIGSFMNNPLSVQAQITSTHTLTQLQVYLNRQMIAQQSGSFGNEYFLNWSLQPQALTPQNLLEVVAIDQSGGRTKIGVIFYGAH